MTSNLDRTTIIDIKDVGKTKVSIPADARPSCRGNNLISVRKWRIPAVKGPGSQHANPGLFSLQHLIANPLPALPGVPGEEQSGNQLNLEPTSPPPQPFRSFVQIGIHRRLSIDDADARPFDDLFAGGGDDLLVALQAGGDLQRVAVVFTDLHLAEMDRVILHHRHLRALRVTMSAVRE